jgi:hypothetical protein
VPGHGASGRGATWLVIKLLAPSIAVVQQPKQWWLAWQGEATARRVRLQAGSRWRARKWRGSAVVGAGAEVMGWSTAVVDYRRAPAHVRQGGEIWGRKLLACGPTQRHGLWPVGRPDTRGPLGSDGRERKREWDGRFAGLGQRGRKRPAKEKSLLSFQINFQILKSENKSKKILTDLRKLWIFFGGSLEYFGHIFYWALWSKVNKIQMKNRIQFWTWVWIRFDWIYSKLGSNSSSRWF